jgi:hypothetical protein
MLHSRPQWSRGLRRGLAAARLLGLQVRIPPGHGCLPLVSLVCCQVWVSASRWSLVQRSPTECVSLNVITCNNNPPRLQWVGRIGLNTKERIRATNLCLLGLFIHQLHSNPLNRFGVIFMVYLIMLSEYQAIQRRRLVFSNSSAFKKALLTVQVHVTQCWMDWKGDHKYITTRREAVVSYVNVLSSHTFRDSEQKLGKWSRSPSSVAPGFTVSLSRGQVLVTKERFNESCPELN